VKAIRQYEFGDPSVLRYEEVPDPVPGPDQVLIQVSAVGVHLVDTTLRRGSAGGPPLPTLPYTPGREVTLGGRVVLFGWAAGAPFDFTVWDLYRQGLTVSCAIGPRITRRPGGIRSLETPPSPVPGPP
jgi:NADPH:quinone reductase